MLNLAIECSGIVGSVALFDSDSKLGQIALTENKSSIQSLAPAIQQVLLTANIEQPDFISITNGPGSFTSLRVGLTTAKMLAMAWNIPIASIDSLEALASRTAQQNHGTDRCNSIIVAVMNAFRKQVFAAAWQLTNEEMHRLAPSQVVNAADWCDQPLKCLRFDSTVLTATHEQEKGWVTGPGLSIYTPHEASSRWPLVPSELWSPRASDVAQLGWHKFQSGQTVSAERLAPNYVRASAAEEQSMT